MTEILEILKYILPSIIVLATAYYLLRLYLTNDHKKMLLEIKQSNRNLVTPIRLQAFERVIMLLERISPSNLLIRMNNPSFSAIQLQTVLVRTIRDEFDHNLSQQVYISSVAWDLLKNAKEETIKLINLAASGSPQSASATELATRIIEISASIEKSPSAIAQEYIKNEIRNLFKSCSFLAAIFSEIIILFTIIFKKCTLSINKVYICKINQYQYAYLW